MASAPVATADPNSWAELKAIPDDIAMTVKPIDIPNPVNVALLGTPPELFSGTEWDGSTAAYPAWRTAVLQVLDTSNLAWVTQGLRGTDGTRAAMHAAILGDPVFIHDRYPALTKAACRRLDAGRTATLDSATRAVYGFLTITVNDATRQQICEDGVDLGRCPDKFLEAAAKLAQGTTASTTGSQALADFFGLTWPNGGTVSDQVTAVFLNLHQIRQVSIAVNETAYEIKPEAAIVKVIALLPAGLVAHKRTYLNATTLAELKSEMMKDAEDADRSVAAGIRSFAAVDMAAFEAKIEAKFQAKFDALAARNGRAAARFDDAAGRTRTDGRVRHSHAVMTDPSKPPPDGRNWNFCVHHGSWSTSHDSDHCFKAHPEQAPAHD